MHYPWEAPGRFLSRCETPTTDDPAYNGQLYNYCGMNLMLDEAIGMSTILSSSLLLLLLLFLLLLLLLLL